MDDELTESEEEAVAREVHATHARIVFESEPKAVQFLKWSSHGSCANQFSLVLLEFLFNHLFEEYFSPINVHAEENNNDQAANASILSVHR
ncbi:hypothetical protein Tco_0176839, partial [Tanacetum coccineum]